MHREDPAQLYRTAERRLRETLLGDGTYTAGFVKGEEPRRLVLRELRLMREAFEAAAAQGEEDRARRAEARVADLEEELRRLASSATRTEGLRKASSDSPEDD